MSTNNNTRILSDIFFDVLEKNSNKQQKIWINKVRADLQIPECAELFYVVLVNALGVKTPIAEDTVHKAIDCLISRNKADIEMSSENFDKEERKRQMTNWFKFCEQILLQCLKREGLLISPYIQS